MATPANSHWATNAWGGDPQGGQLVGDPAHLAGDDKEKAIRIAALLQTLDSDSNPENGITLDKAQVAQLGIVELGSDDAFNTSSGRGAETAGLTKAVVSLAAAKAHLSATWLASMAAPWRSTRC